MKKTILLTSLLLITILSFGQDKKAELAGWYNYTSAAESAGVTFDTIYPTLYSDSTVISTIFTDSGEIKVGNNNLHNIGQTFDPKFEFFSDPDALRNCHHYRVDSVSFSYKYNHIKDTSVDTLRIQFYINAQVRRVDFSNGDSALSPQYNWQQNRSTSPNFVSEIEVLLDSNFDTKNEMGKISIPIPNGGLTAIFSRYAAFSISYHSYHKADSGDTIDHSLQPQKRLNQFAPQVLIDRIKVPIEYHVKNYGLFINTESRYSLPPLGWHNLYRPGNAFLNEKRYFSTSFYVATAWGCIDNVESITNLTGLSIYPNPTNNNQELNINFELKKQEELTITITDITGRTVKEINAAKYQQGKHHIITDLIGLNKGMYYVSIISSDGARTSKPIVIN